MSYIYVADKINYGNHNHTISIKNEIAQTELDELNSAFSICGIYHAITQIEKIVVQNGLDFKNFMVPGNLHSMRVAKIDPVKLIFEANRLSLNYATSIKTYIDMEERILSSKKSKAEISDFRNSCSQFYDHDKEYRFWVNFRNYVVHCEFPYCKYSETMGENCKVICTKEHLLKFNNWKHSKADIVAMNSEIDLPGMVYAMSSIVVALYIDFFNYFGEQIVGGIEIYGKFCRKYSVKAPIILHTNKPRDTSSGYFQPLPVGDLITSFNILKSNPHVKIEYVDNMDNSNKQK